MCENMQNSAKFWEIPKFYYICNSIAYFSYVGRDTNIARNEGSALSGT